MVPEILRAVLDADGKRAHLVTPFLEQYAFCGRSGYLVAGALTGDAWHCLDEEWREKVRPFPGEDRRAGCLEQGSGPKSLLQEWAVYVTEDRQIAAYWRSDCAA